MQGGQHVSVSISFLRFFSFCRGSNTKTRRILSEKKGKNFQTLVAFCISRLAPRTSTRSALFFRSWWSLSFEAWRLRNSSQLKTFFMLNTRGEISRICLPWIEITTFNFILYLHSSQLASPKTKLIYALLVWCFNLWYFCRLCSSIKTASRRRDRREK